MRTETRTTLFTDVVGSTELVAALGDRAGQRVLLGHVDDLRRETQRARGSVVKTLGDGIMSVFESAVDATACAMAMQRATAHRPVPGRTFAIRVGMSSGDVWFEDDDWHGVSVVEANRLCAAAASGQILVAEATRLLTRGNHTGYRRVGDLTLKGLPEPVSAWELDWETEPEAKLRVVIADDAVLIRQGLAHVLEERGFEVVGQANDGEELFKLAVDLRPDVAIVDVHMPPTFGAEGLKAAERIRAEHPEMGVLVVSQDVDEPSARRLLALGRTGLGYLLKERVTNVGEFADAVRSVARGGTAFEATVLAWLARKHAAEEGIHELTEDELDALQPSGTEAHGSAPDLPTSLD